VRDGGWLYGDGAPASRNEFNEEQAGLADVFGLASRLEVETQPGRFDLRGALNRLPWLDHVQPAQGGDGFGALGVKVKLTPVSAIVAATFSNGAPAVVTNRFGRGVAVCVATCPALSYAKDARFVPAELKEKWPATQREFINAVARHSGAPRLVELSQPVVEAGVFEAPGGAALVLANFTYEPIPQLEVRLPVNRTPRSVRSLERGSLPFTVNPAGQKLAEQGYRQVVRCTVALGLNDLLLFE
jgi:hypothetical protein